MKAIGLMQYGDKSVLQEIEMQTPLLGDNDVLIEVYAAGVNPVDWKIREGLLQDVISYDFPLVLGWDVAGVVAAIGKNVTVCKVGDEVYSRPDIERNGTYAEYVAVDEKYVAEKPRNLSFEHLRTSLSFANLSNLLEGLM
ncbi:NADP-dependent oxidoreductase, partial [Bacillus sp. SS-TM]